MNKQKGFAPILIVIIIAVLVGGYLIYQNQPKPIPTPTTQLTSAPTPTPESTNSAETANWKTYTGYYPEYTYSIKYPSNLSYIDVGAGPDSTNTVHFDNGKENVFSISVANIPHQENQLKLVVENSKEFEIDGFKGVILNNKLIFITKGNQTYSLVREENFSETTFNQILSTFKFLP